MSKKWIIALLITVLLPGIVVVFCDTNTTAVTTTVGFVQQLTSKGYKVTKITDNYAKNQEENYKISIYTIEMTGTKVGDVEIVECNNIETANLQKQKAIEVINSPTSQLAASQHLYGKGNLLVEYVGSNQKLQNNLEKFFGVSLVK